MKYLKAYEYELSFKKYFILKLDEEIVIGELVKVNDIFVSFYELYNYINGELTDHNKNNIAKLQTNFFNNLLIYMTDSLEDAKEQLYILTNINKYNI